MAPGMKRHSRIGQDRHEAMEEWQELDISSQWKTARRAVIFSTRLEVIVERQTKTVLVSLISFVPNFEYSSDEVRFKMS